MSKWLLIDHKYTSRCALDGTPYIQEQRSYQIKNWLDNLIDQHDPAGFLIVSGGEADISSIYGLAIDELKPWCDKTGRKIYAFASCKQYDYDYPDHVVPMICKCYDTVNFHQVLSAFCPNQEDKLLVPPGDDYSPDLLFTCYNNRGDTYRSYTINSLFGKDLQDLGIISYRHFTVVQPKQSDWKPEDWKQIENVPYLMPLEDPLEDQFVLNTKEEWRPNNLAPSYFRGVIDIVTESRIDKDEFYLSEKTNKPLFAHKPFLVVGAPGYHRWLKEERQLELYDEIFDYSFDDEPDYKKRIDGIIDNIERLSTIYKSPEDYKQLWNSVKAKTQRNFFRYMADMRSGVHLESIMHFIGLNSDDPNEYRPENLEKYLTPDYMNNTGNDLFWVLDFFREVVVPYRNNSSYIGDDLLDRYQNFFSVDESLKEIWLPIIE